MHVPAENSRPPGKPLIVKPKWNGAILVCGKCARKCKDGKTLRRVLRDEAARHLPEMTRKRKTKIIKTACLGLCPRNAVVVASAKTLACGEVVLLRDKRDVASALTRLLPDA